MVYADLDGTLLGPRGSLFAVPGAPPSARAARAVVALHEAGVELVLVSGRSRPGVLEPARLLGAGAHVAELGALLVEGLPPEATVVTNFGAFPGGGTPFEAMARSGAGAFLLERFRGRLEPYPPWSAEPREATMLFRGLVDPVEATAALEAAGYGWLELQDNGRLHRPSPHLDLPEVHALHLTPRGVTKASAVRLHRERHGIPAEAAVAVGDSATDLGMAAEVRMVIMVAGGAGAATEAPPPNAFAVEAACGDGFAEAVGALLRPGH